MSEVSEIVVNQMNEVQTNNTVESELANAAYVFQARMGGMERKVETLGSTMTEQFGQVHEKLDLLMLMAIDEGVTAKVEAQTKLVVDGFEAQTKLVVDGFQRIVCCLFVVIFMQVLCYMQYSRHLQWVKEVADQPRETPDWASRFEGRGDLLIMWDGLVWFSDFVFMMRPEDE